VQFGWAECLPVTQEAAGSSPVAPANLDPSSHVESVQVSPIAGNIGGPTKVGDSVAPEDCGQFLNGDLYLFCHFDDFCSW